MIVLFWGVYDSYKIALLGKRATFSIVFQQSLLGILVYSPKSFKDVYGNGALHQ